MVVRSYKSEVLSRLNDISTSFRVLEIGGVNFGSRSYPIHCINAVNHNPDGMNVFLSGGVHGEEPAGVYALLEFFREKVFRYLHHFNFYAIPCLNPSGFENNSRVNLYGENINCSFTVPKPTQVVSIVKDFLGRGPGEYLFSIDMHEDAIETRAKGFLPEDYPEGFYLYEVSETRQDSIGRRVLSEIERRGVGVCKDVFIYDDKNDKGLLWTKGLKDPAYEDADTLEGYAQHYTRHAFTAETPTVWSLERRIEAHIHMLTATLDDFLRNIKFD